jgi:hypothetical protein
MLVTGRFAPIPALRATSTAARPAEDLAHHLLDREIPRSERGEFDTKLAQVNASNLISLQECVSAQARLPAATPQSDCARQLCPCPRYRRLYHDRPKYGSPASRP